MLPASSPPDAAGPAPAVPDDRLHPPLSSRFMKPSIARLTLVGALALAVALAVAFSLLYTLTMLHLEHRSRQGSPEVLAALAHQIQAIALRARTDVHAMANAPLTREVLAQLATSEPEAAQAARTRHAALLEHLFPDMEHMELLTPAEAEGREARRAVLPEPAQAVLRAVTAEPAAGEAMAVESQSLILSAAVRDPADRHLLGFVLARRPMDDIAALVVRAPLAGGYVEPYEQQGAQGKAVFAQGDASASRAGPPRELHLAGTPWRVRYWAAPPLTGLVSDLPNAFVSVWIGLTLFTALVTRLVYHYANRLLQDDLAAIVKLFSDVSHNRLRKRYAVESREVEPAYRIMYGLGKLVVGRHLAVVSSAGLDHLSQVHNRRSFEAKQREIFKQVHEGWPASLLILDIDDFKRVNDSYGHDAGDRLIVQFGRLLEANVRSSDFVARLGGDEFCIVFPNTPLKRAAELAERLRRNLPPTLELGPGITHALSWSGGLSEYSRQDTLETAALARADQALLAAKRAGRNRTQVQAA